MHILNLLYLSSWPMRARTNYIPAYNFGQHKHGDAQTKFTAPFMFGLSIFCQNQTKYGYVQFKKK